MRFNIVRSRIALPLSCAVIGVAGLFTVAGCTDGGYIETGVGYYDTDPYYTAPYYTNTVWVGPGYYYDHDRRVYHYYRDRGRWEHHDWDRGHDRDHDRREIRGGHERYERNEHRR